MELRLIAVAGFFEGDGHDSGVVDEAVELGFFAIVVVLISSVQLGGCGLAIP